MLKKPVAALVLCGLLAPIEIAHAEGVSEEQKQVINAYITPRLPQAWSVVHITRSDHGIVAYLTMPIAMAFEMAYRPQDTRDILEGLCPHDDGPFWKVLGRSDLDVIPVANGKGFFRVRCKPPGTT